MKKIYIFGLGQGKAFVDRCLLWEQTDCIGFINNYKTEEETASDGIPILKQEELSTDFDYIIVTLMQYEETRQGLIRQGVRPEKVICFFDLSDADKEEYWSVLDPHKWKTELMWRHYRSVTMPTIDNLMYEIYADSKIVKSGCPKIIDVDRTVEVLLSGRKSLARFGDNEFELICRRLRTKYQAVDGRLAERLKEVLHSHEDNLMIAIADNYEKLDKYTDEAAEAIRSYLNRSVRKDHMALLESDREYYDAYLSRPYIIYRDKKKAGKRFENIRKIWDGEDVLIVEGEHTRFGVGNDLLDNAAHISRILAPDKNAFFRYDKIIDEVRKNGRGKLILAILGPTATVLAYDLSKEGYWIIDIGQLDVEYEWYLRGVEEKCNIPYKTVSEVMQYGEIQTDKREEYIWRYQSEVIAKI
ncbi:MAG: DUF1792 domain-containing protein [Lachnospiraceae bacterium]|nr:DUF1792 domain-containing protein [Lachnospiraceae bacterium]